MCLGLLRPDKSAAAFVFGNHLLAATRSRSAAGSSALRPGSTWAGSVLSAKPVSLYPLQITAPAWPAHPKWLAAFVDALGVKIVNK